MSQVVITNLGPDPVHVVDATGTHSDLGSGSHGTFTAPVKVGDGSASAPVESPAPAPTVPGQQNLAVFDPQSPSVFVSPDVTGAQAPSFSLPGVISGGGGDFAGAGAGGSFDTPSSDSSSASTSDTPSPATVD